MPALRKTTTILRSLRCARGFCISCLSLPTTMFDTKPGRRLYSISTGPCCLVPTQSSTSQDHYRALTATSAMSASSYRCGSVHVYAGLETAMYGYHLCMEGVDDQGDTDKVVRGKLGQVLSEAPYVGVHLHCNVLFTLNM